jgi:protein TonB
MPDGQAASVKVAASSGFSILDQAALAAVMKWQFLPATRNGIAVREEVRIPIEFRLR